MNAPSLRGLGPLVLGTFATLSWGCKDPGEKSATLAAEHASFLATLVDKDVGEVERGLPEGAKRATAAFADGAGIQRDPQQVRKGLQKIQRDVSDLLVAKSTFFALVDDKGIAIRNNLEPDAMAGKDLFALFPALKTADTTPFVTTVGQFPEAAIGPRPDRTWVAGCPVKKDDGKIIGYYVTGWSYRGFAHHLQESLLADLKGKLLAAGETGKLPILYVAVFDANGVYAERQTPEVNETTLAGLKLGEATAAGPAHGVVKVTERSYGWAAARTPKLGKDTGVAILRSEI